MNMGQQFYKTLCTVLLMVAAGTVMAQEVRSFDGFKNNPVHPEWGAAHFTINYQVPLAYADQISEPSGSDRPNPRMVSNLLFSQERLLDDVRSLSAFTWAWGQFIDHDITLTEDHPDEEFDVSVPPGDRFFDPAGTGSVKIPLKRSDYDPVSGSDPSNPRRHINSISAFIDASAVYGSDLGRANWLRTFEDGKLKVSEGNMPPFNTVDGEYDSDIDVDAPGMAMPIPFVQKFYVCGDVRANENPCLLSMHTLFVREHNRQCDKIKAKHPDWDDETIYQHARRLVGGIMQAIVYEEWLPALGVHLPAYDGYKIDVNAQILNVFSAAAYRYGHTTITPVLKRMDDQGFPIPQGDIDLRYAFFNPNATREVNGIDPFLSGMAYVTQQELDLSVIDDLRNFLFGRPGAGGLDLVSLNIQRGRDRGLPSLNDVRVAFGLEPYKDFNAMNPDPAISNKMRECYGSMDKVDPWVGMLSEEHMPDALFGPTAMAIIVEQFLRFRDGDRFYFECDPNIGYAEKAAIKNTRLSDVIRRNTAIERLQDEVFKVEPLPTGTEDQVLPISNVSLYPNPATEFVVLELAEKVNSPLSVRLYDITGRTWISTEWTPDRNRIELNLPEGMRPGYYWVSVIGGRSSWLGRFVKQH